MPWRERLYDGLEAFWDSEAPRIGEQGAQGWAATREDALPPEVHTAPSASMDITHTDHSGRPHERWAAAERQAGQADRPGRATEPGIEDSEDPYRVVLFDDIRPFVLDLKSPDSRHQLAYAFLTFLGLPFMPIDVPTSTPFTTDPFIHSELLERPTLLQQYWPKSNLAGSRPFTVIAGEPMEREARSDISQPWEMPFHAAPTAVDVLFGASSPGWFQAVSAADVTDLDVDLVRCVLALVCS